MARAGRRPAVWCFGTVVGEKAGFGGLVKPPSSSSLSPRPSYLAPSHSRWPRPTLKHTHSLSRSWKVVLIAAPSFFIFFAICIIVGCMCCKKLEDSTMSEMWVNAKTKLYVWGKDTKTKLYAWGKNTKTKLYVWGKNMKAKLYGWGKKAKVLPRGVHWCQGSSHQKLPWFQAHQQGP